MYLNVWSVTIGSHLRMPARDTVTCRYAQTRSNSPWHNPEYRPVVFGACIGRHKWCQLWCSKWPGANWAPWDGSCATPEKPQTRVQLPGNSNSSFNTEVNPWLFLSTKICRNFIAIYIDAKSSTRLLPYYKPMCIDIVRWFRFNGTVGEKIRRFAEILVTRRNYLLTKWCAPSHVHVLWRLVIVMS